MKKWLVQPTLRSSELNKVMDTAVAFGPEASVLSLEHTTLSLCLKWIQIEQSYDKAAHTESNCAQSARRPKLDWACKLWKTCSWVDACDLLYIHDREDFCNLIFCVFVRNIHFHFLLEMKESRIHLVFQPVNLHVQRFVCKCVKCKGAKVQCSLCSVLSKFLLTNSLWSCCILLFFFVVFFRQDSVWPQLFSLDRPESSLGGDTQRGQLQQSRIWQKDAPRPHITKCWSCRSYRSCLVVFLVCRLQENVFDFGGYSAVYVHLVLVRVRRCLLAVFHSHGVMHRICKPPRAPMYITQVWLEVHLRVVWTWHWNTQTKVKENALIPHFEIRRRNGAS